MDYISKQILGVNNKKKDVDFDILVEQKKTMMRSGNTKASTKANTRVSRRSPFEERVNESFAKLSAKSNKSRSELKQLDEIKSIIELFGKLQWGTGEHLTPLCSQINLQLGYKASTHKVHQVLKASLQSNLLQKIPSTKEINFKEIATALSPSLFIELFLTDQRFRVKHFKHLDMTTKHAGQTLLFLYHMNKLKDEAKAFKMSFKQTSTSPSEEQKTSVIFNQNKVIRLETLKSNIEQYVTVFMTSAPIKKLKSKNDDATALEIFGFKTLPDEKKLKDQYKYLVKSRHPDKVEAYQLPDVIKKQIHENFATIQLAYDILKSKKKG
jgi:DnaJ-domain-containing protein 1